MWTPHLEGVETYELKTVWTFLGPRKTFFLLKGSSQLFSWEVLKKELSKFSLAVTITSSGCEDEEEMNRETFSSTLKALCKLINPFWTSSLTFIIFSSISEACTGFFPNRAHGHVNLRCKYKRRCKEDSLHGEVWNQKTDIKTRYGTEYSASLHQRPTALIFKPSGEHGIKKHQLKQLVTLWLTYWWYLKCHVEQPGEQWKQVQICSRFVFVSALNWTLIDTSPVNTPDGSTPPPNSFNRFCEILLTDKQANCTENITSLAEVMKQTTECEGERVREEGGESNAKCLERLRSRWPCSNSSCKSACWASWTIVLQDRLTARWDHWW